MSCTHCGLPVGPTRGGGVVEPSAPRFCCFGCRLAFDLARPSSGADGQPGDAAPSTLVLRLGIGVFASMNIAVFSWFFYSQELYGAAAGGHGGLGGLLAYLLMFLATVAVASLGGPLVADVLRVRRVDATTLICIGVGAAYVLSVFNTVRGSGPLYFDTAAIILVLVTLGHFIDSRARHDASSSARSLLAAVPSRAWVERSGRFEEVELSALSRGETVRVRPAEAIPVDGVVISGEANVDESTLTGESRARSVGPGERVLAGSIVLDAMIRVDAREVGEGRAVAHMQRLLEEARAGKPPLQGLADRVAAGFVPLVVALALGVLAFHALRGNAERGLFDSLSVLLISCPCALGLAAPLATWSALRRAAEHGILIDSPATLERAAQIDHVFFDKTGTLTDGSLELQEVTTFGGVAEDEALRLAAALEGGSVHPVASCLIDQIQRRGLEAPVASAVEVLPGTGVRGRVEGRALELGSERLLAADHELRSMDAASEAIEVFLVSGGGEVLARFRLGERLRGDAARAVAELHASGIGVAILTGDRPAPGYRIGDELGVPVHPSLLPADKVRVLAEQRGQGKRVAMVGDGLNDGAVLASADVGFAIASGTDLAHRAGSVRLLDNRLDRVPLTLAVARHAMSRIRRSLAWAFTYNTVGLGLAACGVLSPVFAAFAMFASSLYIVRSSAMAGDVGAADDPRVDGATSAPVSASSEGAAVQT